MIVTVKESLTVGPVVKDGLITDWEAGVLAHASQNGRYVTGNAEVIALAGRGLLKDYGAQRLADGMNYLTLTGKGSEAPAESGVRGKEAVSGGLGEHILLGVSRDDLAGVEVEGMKTFFPEMDAEIREDRKAARREAVQRSRDYLRGKDTSWLVNQLLDKGPQREHQLLFQFIDEFGDELSKLSEVEGSLVALWRIGKLWRANPVFVPNVGEKSYLYGIRKVHPYPVLEKVGRKLE
jgi:hypothetical protein